MTGVVKILVQWSMVVLLGATMLMQPFVSVRSKSDKATNPVETIKWIFSHVVELEYSSLRDLKDKVPVSDDVPEKQDSESEKESPEKDEFNLDESNPSASSLTAVTYHHSSQCPNFGKKMYWGKIPTPPPEV